MVVERINAGGLQFAQRAWRVEFVAVHHRVLVGVIRVDVPKHVLRLCFKGTATVVGSEAQANGDTSTGCRSHGSGVVRPFRLPWTTSSCRVSKPFPNTLPLPSWRTPLSTPSPSGQGGL